MPNRHDDKLLSLLGHKTFNRFIKIHGNPREVALGFALGVFVGMSPTYGFQIALGVFFAAILKWNKIAAAIGVWITNPVTAPFIYGGTYYLGASILGIETSFSFESVFSKSFFVEFIKNTPLILGALILGGFLVGIPLALMTYFFSFTLLKRYQESVKRAIGKQKQKIVKIAHLKSKHKIKSEADSVRTGEKDATLQCKKNVN